MKISPQWLHDFVALEVDYPQLADDLTLTGLAVESIVGEGDSTVFEMEITTNRPDAMNHFGVARECSAIYRLPLRSHEPDLPPASNKANFSIDVEDPAGCARYTARVVHGTTVGVSSQLIATRLTTLGHRLINSAADASNYVLWEMGHPTHVFDLDLLEGSKIIVRRARVGETLKTLDGVDRKLSPHDLVIADAAKPVALAGVMGGFDTMITAKTKNILIEAASFDPVAVRNSSKRHGLHTDASHRFERGADFESTVLACNRVAELLLKSGGGELLGHPLDVISRRLDQAPVALRVSEVRRILGVPLESGEITDILQRLGFELMPEPGEEPEFTVHIPSWRLDVEREIDLVEELARLHGYDKFPKTIPAYSGAVIEQPGAEKDRKLRTCLLSLGYNEAISSTFVSHQDAADFSESSSLIELANPLTENASVMRPSLIPGMLGMLAHNLNRGNENVRLFEAGNVFEDSESPEQKKRICLGATGSAVSSSVNQPARPISFFDIKGDIETLLDYFKYDKLHYDQDASGYYAYGRAAKVVMDGVPVAQFGQIDSAVASRSKIRRDIFVGEIYLDRLYEHSVREIRYRPLPRFPSVERDFSFIFDDSVTFETISESISNLQLSELQSLVPVEIFRGGSVATGKYSILLRARFQSVARTLREEEVARWSAEIIDALQALGGKQRA
ncbi:MAG: phenylalanine--tRNA ligase subunit beta [Acidobacteriales bacterium]|nr:phenylalanine--tRNA ligase subunit beta [Terriglobales bacterium]